MEVDEGIPSLWLLARGNGWQLGQFLSLLEKKTGVVKRGRTLQEVYLQYCSHNYDKGVIVSLEDSCGGPPLPTQTKLVLKCPSIMEPVNLDDCAGIPHEIPGSPTPGGYHQLEDDDGDNVEETGPRKSYLPIVIFFFLIILAGLCLTFVNHKQKIPMAMKITFPILSISVLLLSGVFIRANVRYCRKFFLPSSVIGGVIGCIVIQLMHVAFDKTSSEHSDDTLSQSIDALRYIPTVAMDIVFGGLFLGQTVPRIGHIWIHCSQQFVYGQILAWGQYAVGLLVGTIFGYYLMEPKQQVFGIILPIGFEGGHGTAVGLVDMFESIGWADGVEFCIASATVGLVVGLLVGISLINWYRRFKAPMRLPDVNSIEQDNDRYRPPTSLDDDNIIEISDANDNPLDLQDPFRNMRHAETERRKAKELMRMTFVPEHQTQSTGRAVVQPTSLDNLAYHLCIVFLAVGFGYGCKSILLMFDPWLEDGIGIKGVFATFPTFPMAMLGGMLIQVGMQRSRTTDKIDTATLSHISNTALDFLVTTSIATIKVQRLASGIGPLIIVIVFGIMWSMFMCLVVAPRFFFDHWFERAIVEFGQSTGVTATGLLLLRLVDPSGENPAYSSFALKQLLHEPIMGGGIWTSVALPLTHKIGPWAVFGISIGVCIFWSLLYRFYLYPQMRPGETLNRLQERMYTINMN